MELKKIEKNIKAYLKEDEHEFFEGVELYSKHPECRNNVVINLTQKWSDPSMHTKLIYELEMLIGENESGRAAKPAHRPDNIPYKIIEKVQLEAPADFTYKVKFEKLPDELKAIAIEKGQLYNSLEISKKHLAEIGQGNDELSISKRQLILKSMHQVVDKIKHIHSILVKYDVDRDFDAGTIDGLNKLSVGGSDQVPEIEQELTETEILDNEFHYLEMEYYERKDLLKRLHSSVIKQEQRASESNKQPIIDKNLKAAELGRKMIEVLQQYFKDTLNPEGEIENTEIVGEIENTEIVGEIENPEPEN